MRRQSELKLSVGPSAARKVMAIGLSVPTAFIAGMMLWLLGGLMYETVAEGPVNLWGELVPHIIVTAVGMMGVYVLGAGLYLMLGAVRFAQLLDGTVLAERVVRRKRVDLATAEIDATYDARRGRVQTLTASAPGNRAEVKVPVSRGPMSLPAGELTALADAITSRRVRSGVDDRAFEVADQIRQLVTTAAAMPPGARTDSNAVRQMAHGGEQPQSHQPPAGSPGTEVDPHRTRDSALIVAIVFVPLLGGCVAIGFASGYGPLAVVIAAMVGLFVSADVDRTPIMRQCR